MWTIVAVSDSDKHFVDAIKEYEKRFSKKIKNVNLKPTKHGTHTQIIQKDTENVIALLEKKYSDWYKICLSKEGKNLSTETFCTVLQTHIDVVFVVGGPYGLDEENIGKIVDMKLSFGQMTLQHSLVKLVLLEQLYRVFMISQGRKYHY